MMNFAVAMAMASSNMVSNVLNDVLSLNKIEEGHLELKCAWFSFVEAFEEVKFMFNEEAVRNGVQLRTSVGDTDTVDQHDIKVYADIDRLKEVLANFCSNAIKFTESGGTVHLHADIRLRAGAPDWPVQAADGEFEPTADIEVSVTDTGQGIAAVDFDKLFVAYSQITPAVRASGRGKSSTGLGLCITKHIIDAHGAFIKSKFCIYMKAIDRSISLCLQGARCMSGRTGWGRGARLGLRWRCRRQLSTYTRRTRVGRTMTALPRRSRTRPRPKAMLTTTWTPALLRTS